MPLDADDPSRWPATFCIIAPDQDPRERQYKALLAHARRVVAGEANGRQPHPPVRQDNPMQQLALRLEALIRAAANPARHIQRPARRISRGTPRRVEMLFAPRFTPWNQFNDHLRILEAELTRLLAEFADSS